jgi:ammonia channel protein AmtB
VRFEVDDPLDNSLIHGFCGLWSIFAVGLFDREKGLLYTGKMGFLAI